MLTNTLPVALPWQQNTRDTHSSRSTTVAGPLLTVVVNDVDGRGTLPYLQSRRVHTWVRG